jgi:uncharacterized tellurite resistance protein B-like protein
VGSDVVIWTGFGLLAMGLLAVLGVFWTSRRSSDADVPRDRPTPSADERDRIIDLSVYLALELSRVDGAIVDSEIKAIEDQLMAGLGDRTRAEAEEIVRRVLKRTISLAQDSGAVDEISRLADLAHRTFLVEMLAAVASADGDVNDDERTFAEPIASRLGVPFEV